MSGLLILSVTSCRKPYVDVECDNVQVCLTNTSSDTIYFNWFGETTYPPEYPESIAPGETVCHGYGPFKEYGKDGLLKDEYSLSGTNAAIIETIADSYYIDFDECDEFLIISQ